MSTCLEIMVMFKSHSLRECSVYVYDRNLLFISSVGLSVHPQSLVCAICIMFTNTALHSTVNSI